MLRTQTCAPQGGEEVHCCNSFTLIAQKCHPPLSRLGTPRHFPHPAQHTALRDVVTEHFQLTMDAWRAPGAGILSHSRAYSRELAPYLMLWIPGAV